MKKLSKKEQAEVLRQVMENNEVKSILNLQNVELGSFGKSFDLPQMLNNFQNILNRAESAMVDLSAMVTLLELLHNVKILPNVNGATINMIKQARKAFNIKMVDLPKEKGEKLNITTLMQTLKEFSSAISNESEVKTP